MAFELILIFRQWTHGVIVWRNSTCQNRTKDQTVLFDMDTEDFLGAAGPLTSSIPSCVPVVWHSRAVQIISQPRCCLGTFVRSLPVLGQSWIQPANFTERNHKELSDDLLIDQSSWSMIWCPSLVEIQIVLVNMARPGSQMRLRCGQKSWHEDNAWLKTRSPGYWGVHFLWSLWWGLVPLRPGFCVVGFGPGRQRARVRPAHPCRWSLRLPAVQEQTGFLWGLFMAWPLG